MEKKLSDIIKIWVLENKKFFWKYEISSYYQTYKISVNHLPDPESENIDVSPKIGLLNAKKIQLSTAIKKACSKSEPLGKASFSIKVDYVDGIIVSVVV